jgi:hypothetical protein
MHTRCSMDCSDDAAAARRIAGARTGGGVAVRGWDTALGCVPVLPPHP